MSVFTGKAGFLVAALNIMTLSVVNTPLSAQEFNSGEALYKNHCTECHETLAHTRPGSRISSMGEIRSWVASWSFHSNLHWSSEEVEDVADYLNRKFYLLTDKP
jgi:mono/diheme cytochrome c family protein